MYVGGENYGLVQETVETENKRLSRKLRLWICNFISLFIDMKVIVPPDYVDEITGVFFSFSIKHINVVWWSTITFFFLFEPKQNQEIYKEWIT